MLKSEWFNLPMERELTLVKINQEVDECTDIKTLRASVKDLAKQNATFQHMLSELLRETLTSEVERLFEDSKIEGGTRLVIMSAAATPTNTSGTKDKFARTYTNYNPAPTQGPLTEILATVLNPSGS